MPWSFDAKTLGTRGTGNPVTVSHTCAATADLLVVVLFINGTTARTGGVPTYNSVDMTDSGEGFVFEAAGECGVEVWYLLDPDTGSSYTVSVPNSGAVSINISVMSFGSSSEHYQFLWAKSATGTTQNPTLNISSTGANCLIIGGLGSGDRDVPTAGSGYTLGHTEDIGNQTWGSQYDLDSDTTGLTLQDAVNFGTARDDDWGLIGLVFYDEILTSIGTRTAENVDISSSSGSDPYTVNLASAPSNTVVGDALTDENATPRTYLITAISGSTLTVIDSEGAGGAPDSSGTSQATTTRYYSSPSAWNSDLDDTNLYQSNDYARGEAYDDGSTYGASTISGGTTVGLAGVHLTVADGERHNGTRTSGARVSGSNIECSRANTRVSWWEVDGGVSAITHNASGDRCQVDHCWVYGCYNNFGAVPVGISVSTGAFSCIQHNNFIADVHHEYSTETCYGISSVTAGRHYCNSVIDVRGTTGSVGSVYGMSLLDTASTIVYNNISMDTAANVTNADFNPSSPASADMDYNMSSDTSASGTNSLTNESSSNEFVSNTRGSENLHLKSGANAIDEGDDIIDTTGTNYPIDVHIDIDGRDRHANADVWDMGAHEFVAVAVTNKNLLLLGVG